MMRFQSSLQSPSIRLDALTLSINRNNSEPQLDNLPPALLELPLPILYKSLVANGNPGLYDTIFPGWKEIRIPPHFLESEFCPALSSVVNPIVTIPQSAAPVVFTSPAPVYAAASSDPFHFIQQAYRTLDGLITTTQVTRIFLNGPLARHLAKISGHGAHLMTRNCENAGRVAKAGATQGTEIATNSDDVVLVAARELIGKTGAEFLEAAQVATASLGPIVPIVGYLLDDAVVARTEKKIRNAFLTYSPLELFIAIEYAKKCEKNGGKCVPLDDLEVLAITSLRITQEYNGGAELLGNEIIRDIGTIAGIGGAVVSAIASGSGALSGVAVFGVVKMLCSGKYGVPSLEEIDEKIKDMKWHFSIWGAVAAIFDLVSVSTATTATLSTFAAAKAAAKKIRSKAEEWHELLNDDAYLSSYLLRIGLNAKNWLETAEDKFHPDVAFTQHLGVVESAVKNLNNGKGQYSRADMLKINMFIETAPHFRHFLNSLTLPEDSKDGLKRRFEGMVSFCHEAKIMDNMGELVRNASDS